MQYQKTPRRGKRMTYLLLVVFLLAAYCSFALTRPLPLLASNDIPPELKLTTPTASLPWPAYGQAAVGVAGNKVLSINGEQKPLPIASVAKVITVLCVLQKKPLALNQAGPNLTIGAKDIALYNEYAAKDGSLVPVNSGEVISQYQALQTVLLPSANNMADSLAIWAFGSLESYRAYANNYVKKLGMKNTTVGSDASGFSPNTVSTAEDLVKLGKVAMLNPVIAQIVGQSVAHDIPVAGSITNVNSLLGTGGIIGIKTGNTEEAGGVFLGAANTLINGKEVTVVTAIVGAPNLGSALRDTRALIAGAQANFATVSVLSKGAIVGHYRQPWGGAVAIMADQDLSVTAWRGSTVTARTNTKKVIQPAFTNGEVVGTIEIPANQADTSKAVGLRLSGTPTRPTLLWELLHPLR